MNQPLLKCEHVDFGYENYDVVKDVSMEIVPGDYLCIVGENGSGKSTLMKGLLGLLKPTGGVLTIADELKRSGIGYLPQQTPAQKDFPATVQEVVTSGCLGKRGNRPFILRESGRSRSQYGKARNHGSEKELLPGSLRRTETAYPDREALCATDKLLILDEPITDLTGIDPGFLRGDPPSEQGREGRCPHGLPRYRKYRDAGQQDLTVETDGPVLRDVEEYKKSEFGREFLGGEN